MRFNLRKILIITGFVLAIIAIGSAIYFTFFRAPAEEGTPTTPTTPVGGGGLPIAGISVTQPSTSTPTTPTTGTGGLPTAATISTSDLTISAAQNITLSSDGRSAQYYDSTEGRFYKIDANGALTPLSNKQFFQVQNVTWSNNKDVAVLEYPDGSNIVYNFNTNTQTTLPKHWEDFQFSTDDSEVYGKSIGTDPSNRWLVVSDLNGGNVKALYALGENADKVQVAPSSNNQIVGFSSTGDSTSEFGTREIYLLGKNKENFKSLKVRGFDFKAKWAEEGDRILYSVSNPENQYKPTLWLVDGSTSEIGNNAVQVNLDTWVDKCVILSGYKAYCAVPKSLDSGSGFDINSATNTDDLFYSIDLQTGATTFIGEPDTDYSVKQISVDSNENYIYFTDNLTGALHKLQIGS